MEAAPPIAGGIPVQVPQLPQNSMEVAAQVVNRKFIRYNTKQLTCYTLTCMIHFSGWSGNRGPALTGSRKVRTP